jgi:hypothetical protein
VALAFAFAFRCTMYCRRARTYYEAQTRAKLAAGPARPLAARPLEPGRQPIAVHPVYLLRAEAERSDVHADV